MSDEQREYADTAGHAEILTRVAIAALKLNFTATGSDLYSITNDNNTIVMHSGPIPSYPNLPRRCITVLVSITVEEE